MGGGRLEREGGEKRGTHPGPEVRQPSARCEKKRKVKSLRAKHRKTGLVIELARNKRS